MDNKYNILWADDEIDMLKPHVMFLQEKGFAVDTVVSGQDALDAITQKTYDLVLLDEQMPGITGLETLQGIKAQLPHMPIVMITKSEEEDLMNQALGSKISDYLIKPVNPNQLLLCLKKNLQQNNFISDVVTKGYQKDFSKIGIQMSDTIDLDGWKDLYKKLVYWELQLEGEANAMSELLDAQKMEAGRLFGKYICRNYENWINSEERPTMSPDLFKKHVFPLIDSGEKVFFILIDNFRFDQWESVKGMVQEFYTTQEDMYLSILPTATQYARNSIFSGLMPLDISKMFPDLWVDEESEEGKNLNEEPMIKTLLDRYRKKYSFSYNKVYETKFGERFLSNLSDLKNNDLNVVVLNFVDMLSHARTESKMIRELAVNEAAYRSITNSWFKHSTTYNLFKKIAEMGYKVILTTDHGTIRVKNPVKIVGDRNTNTNLRYKVGKSLNYNPKEVFEVHKPESIGLPKNNLSDKYVFSLNNDFFAYPNNYNYYVQYYKDTFQHGGISLEEMLIPIITMTPKK